MTSFKMFKSPRVLWTGFINFDDFPPGYQNHGGLPNVVERLKGLDIPTKFVEEIAHEIWGGSGDRMTGIQWR